MILHRLLQVHQKLLVQRHVAQALKCTLLVAIRGQAVFFHMKMQSLRLQSVEKRWPAVQLIAR